VIHPQQKQPAINKSPHNSSLTNASCGETMNIPINNERRKGGTFVRGEVVVEELNPKVSRYIFLIVLMML